MAVHAGLGRRNSGKAGILNRGVAIAAIQPEASGMVLMAERYWLLWRDMLRRDIGRALKLHKRRTYRREQEHYAKNAGARQSI